MYLGGGDLTNISVGCLRAAVCLYPFSVSGLVGVGLRRVWVKSTDACVDASFEEILGNFSVSGKHSVVSGNISLVVLGTLDFRQS